MLPVPPAPADRARKRRQRLRGFIQTGDNVSGSEYLTKASAINRAAAGSDNMSECLEHTGCPSTMRASASQPSLGECCNVEALSSERNSERRPLNFLAL